MVSISLIICRLSWTNKCVNMIIMYTFDLECLIKKPTYFQSAHPDSIDQHCVKSVRMRSYSGPNFPAFGLNTERYSVSCLMLLTFVKDFWQVKPNLLITNLEAYGFERESLSLIKSYLSDRQQWFMSITILVHGKRSLREYRKA